MITLSSLIPPGIRSYIRSSYWRVRYSTLRLGDGCSLNDVTLGKNVRIGNGSTVVSSAIGDHTYIGPGAEIRHATIRKFCSIAPSISIGLSDHLSSGFVSTHPIFYLPRPDVGLYFAKKNRIGETPVVDVGNDVWLGQGVAVKAGISIADGAVIGAGAVVTRNVPAYAIYAGVPARLLRYRFEPEEIKFLQSFRWWDRDEAWLKNNLALFLNIKNFYREYSNLARPQSEDLKT